MSISQSELQILWPTASYTGSITTASNLTSEVFTPSSTAFGLWITVKADNTGTPAAGDTVEFYLVATAGDPDGTGAAEYATSGHGQWLKTLDTNTDDPAVATFYIPAGFKSGKLYVTNSGASTVTVSAVALEMRA
jgi:hypothetical protein